MRILIRRLVLLGLVSSPPAQADDPGVTVCWEKDLLTIRAGHLPAGEVKVWYLEAYCRPGSTNRNWRETVIPHRTRLLERSPDGRLLRLRCELSDGVIVDHTIRAGRDEVDFRLIATNPTRAESLAHWAQPCIRVAPFTGVAEERNSEAYLSRCFVMIDGRPQWLPTSPWATRALYTPGQVWCPAHVRRGDVNPRPLSSLVPSEGLIGCRSADGKWILATAWEPYQELFQGIIVCLHSDFRIGGLKPGESKAIRGKIYLVDTDLDTLIRRYRKDFPEHRSSSP